MPLKAMARPAVAIVTLSACSESPSRPVPKTTTRKSSASGRETIADVRRSLPRIVSKSDDSGTSPSLEMRSIDECTSPRSCGYCWRADAKSSERLTTLKTLCLSVDTMAAAAVGVALYGV